MTKAPDLHIEAPKATTSALTVSPAKLPVQDEDDKNDNTSLTLTSSERNKRQTQFLGSPARHAIKAVEKTTPKGSTLDDSAPVSAGKLDSSPVHIKN